jgi:glycine/D-amino acid oxidase-like deaminating enzyme/CRP-like cAMP-binding protein
MIIIADNRSAGVLETKLENVVRARRLLVADVVRIAEAAHERCSATHGRADDDLSHQLRALEATCEFGPGAAAHFQQLLARLGVVSSMPIGMPLDREPYWLRAPHPLANYQSHALLPSSADVVIIGAGLTGASTAYHLRAEARNQGLRVVVLDRGDPACEASGRNGGNFELIPENCIGMYEGLSRVRSRFLRRCYPAVPEAVRQAESERQASLVFGLAVRNRERLKAIVRQEAIACDFSPRGWLYLATSELEEQALCEEMMLAAQQGQRIELWSRRRIREEFGFKTAYLGRFISGDGTYHPFKYVCELLQRALRLGVELYTRHSVLTLESEAFDRIVVVTDRGSISASRVIVATNAFTSQLLPELAAIRPFQSQVMVTEHVVDRTRGRVVTTEYGPTFFNQPRGGVKNGRAPLLMGGGADRPMRNPASRRRSAAVHTQLLQLRDAFYPELRGQPPSTEWIGPMGFTPDQLPAIGFLKPGVIVAAGFNGYGGSYTTAAGQAAARMALTGEPPDWVPEDVFSPLRLVDREPLFMRAHESLWRIAASLCGQLRTVEAQTADSVAFATPAGRRRKAHHHANEVGMLSSAACPELDARRVRRSPAFRNFTPDELTHVVRLMRRWEAPQGALVCAQGSSGGSCFVVVSGIVDVTTQLGGKPRRLASLGPGSIFGQVSLIDGQPRSATCSMREAGVLLEMEQEPCARLFDERSSAALKFLSAINQGLIAALRGADRRLLRAQPEATPLVDRDLASLPEPIPL